MLDSTGRLPAWARWPAWCLVGPLLLLSVGGLLSRPWWVELAAHFRVVYFWILLPASLVSLVLRERLLLATASAGLLLNGWLLFPLYVGAGTGVPVGRLVFLNVLTSNPRPESVVNFIQNSGSDVIVLAEVNEPWLEHLAPVLKDYPGQLLHPRSDNFGIALLSRQPLHEAAVLSLGAVPSLAADTRVGPLTLHVVGTHPLPPISARASAARNQQLGELANYLVGRSGPTALFGDLNNTPWAPSMAPLEGAGLVNARRGFGVLPTWPASFLYPLQIPIDHCYLGGSGFEIVGCRLGPEVGSDHRPLMVDVGVSSRGTPTRR